MSAGNESPYIQFMKNFQKHRESIIVRHRSNVFLREPSTISIYNNSDNVANLEYEFWATPNAGLIRTTTFSESYWDAVGVYIVTASGNLSFQEGTRTDIFPIQTSGETCIPSLTCFLACGKADMRHTCGVGPPQGPIISADRNSIIISDSNSFIDYCSTNLPDLFQSSHKFLKIPLPDPSKAPIHISLSYVPKTPNSAYNPGVNAFCTPSSMINSGYSANKATYSIINHGTCFDTAFPVLAELDESF